MAHGSSGTHQNPYKLLLLEVMLHILAASLVVLHMPLLPDSSLRYGFVAAVCSAIVLRVFAALVSTSDSSISGSYGRSAGSAQVITTLLLGLAWGVQLPLLTSLTQLPDPVFSTLPVATSIPSLVL